jgi:hypothetical protein
VERFYYSDFVEGFLDTEVSSVIGTLATNNEFSLDATQRDAWVEQIRVLKLALVPYRRQGKVYFEYSIPRLGRRIDVVALIGRVVFVLEFKVGETKFAASALDQVWDYSLDLKNFHEPSHHCIVAPILIATKAEPEPIILASSGHSDGTLQPLKCNAATLSTAFRQVMQHAPGSAIDPEAWEQGQYHPTPTIIEAATALYKGHSVTEISRSDATAINLSRTEVDP